MAAVDDYPEAQQRLAALVLALYLRPSWWLLRRTDATFVRDIGHVGWRSTLQIAIQFRELRAAGLWSGPAPTAMMLPVLLEERELLTGLKVTDDDGRPVSTLTWEQTRPLIELMLLGTAEQVVRVNLRDSLPTLVRAALRHFSGDIDEVSLARKTLEDWRDYASRDSTCHRQASALLSDPAMRLLLRDYTRGFIVMASAPLRADGTCTLVIDHDSPIRGFRLRMPVSSCADYQCEIHLPAGAVFSEKPGLQTQIPRLVDEAPDRKFTRPFDHKPVLLGKRRDVAPRLGYAKELEAWAEVRGPLLAGYAPAQPRGTVWLLDLTPYKSVRNAHPGLADSVRQIALVTMAMFLGGLICRSLGMHPFDPTSAVILAALPTAYAVLLLQRSGIPTRELVEQAPRSALMWVAGVTLLGAGTLAVSIPGQPPFVSTFGWGWRAALWVGLTVVSIGIAAIVTIRSRLAW